MLPLKLIIKGLYSYQKEQIIDFTKLTEANLFGIFGSVGSGKSSIIEAISYALYGETERLNQRDNRSYNMMNLKCGDLLIDFYFMAGVPEKEYRCLVSCKRHKTVFERVPSLTRTAYEDVNGEWVPIELGQIPHIIGLSYDNFRRTIIIPQGRFSEFLQLGDKDRTDMLKEIFHLEKFEYTDQVNAIDKRNTEKINVLLGKIEQLGEVTQAEIDEQKKILHELLELVDHQKEILEQKVSEEKRMSDLKKVFTNLGEMQKALEQLETKVQFFRQLAQDIKDYEKCLIEFKPVLDQKKENEEQFQLNKNELDILLLKSSNLKKVHIQEEQEFVQIQRSYNDKDQYKTKAEELKRILRIQLLGSEIEAINERIDKGLVFVEKIQTDISALHTEKETVKTLINQKKNALPDVTVLSEVSNWYTIHRGIQENIDWHRKQIAEIQQIIFSADKLNFSPTLNFKRWLEDNFHDIFLINIEKLNHWKTTITSETDQITVEIEHLAVESRLEEFVATLKENEPCPLCGSLHHPAVLSIEVVGLQLEKLKARKSELSGLIKEIEQWVMKERERMLKIESYKGPLKKETDQLNNEEEKLKTHLEKFIWKEFEASSSQKLDEVFKSSKKLQEEIKNLEIRLESTLKSIDKEQEKKEKYLKVLHQLNVDLSGKTSEQSTYQKQIMPEILSQFIHRSTQEISQEEHRLLKEYEHIVNRFNNLSESISKGKQLIARIEGQINEKENLKTALITALGKSTEALKLILSKSEYKSIEEVKIILSRNIDVQKERLKLKSFEEEYFLKRKQVEELLLQTSDKQYDFNLHEDLIKQISYQSELISQSNKELGRLAGEIKLKEANLAEKNQLTIEINNLYLRRDDINVMRQLFKGSGFVNYVSSVFLKNLCNAANDRFYKLTRQKLRLELTDSNNFQVRDFLNNGQVRSVKTLSGGQIFQASLSLALALAESIQQQNKAKQNFFFLDEGFGSQDKDSLNIVLDTLKSLRVENRIVGVISHVQELQQEIDVYLDVRNDEEQGSQIKGSWE